jgi:hypothetical protein
MNKDKAHLYLPYVQAMADGKTVQWKTDSGNWKDGVNLGFSENPEDYRIKPEPRTFEMYRTKDDVMYPSKGYYIPPNMVLERITLLEVLK